MPISRVGHGDPCGCCPRLSTLRGWRPHWKSNGPREGSGRIERLTDRRCARVPAWAAGPPAITPRRARRNRIGHPKVSARFKLARRTTGSRSAGQQRFERCTTALETVCSPRSTDPCSVEPPGVAPGFSPCRGDVFLLDDGPEVEAAGIEPASLRCERSVFPLSPCPRGWIRPASLRLPPACKTGALLIELRTRWSG